MIMHEGFESLVEPNEGNIIMKNLGMSLTTKDGFLIQEVI